jgi:hypothetical protein
MQRAAAIFEKKCGAEHAKTQESRLLVSSAGPSFHVNCTSLSRLYLRQAGKFLELAKEASVDAAKKADGGAKKNVQVN